MTTSKRVRLALITWLGMLGVDFLLNGAIFARLYATGGAFMLAPADAFRRIPLGYLAFLIVAFGVVEIAHRLRVSGMAGGIRLGLALGGVVGSAWAFSLYSITRVDAPVAAAWAVIWIALLTVGSVVAAAGLARWSLSGVAIRVAAFDVACVVIVIGLQSVGAVPTVTP